MLVTVMGATGKTGHVVTERLLAGGAKVRAVGRDQNKLQPLTKKGAEPVIADVTRAADLTAAFRGADAIYALIPPKYDAPDPLAYYEQVTGAIVTAIRESGVRRVVFLSSLGAEQTAGTGPIVGLHRAEEKLNAIPNLDLLILRPGYFYENHFGSMGLIKSQGINGSATQPDVPVPQIASQDIGVAAAKALLEGDFSGSSVRELVGPRDLTMAEATRILGSKIGKPDLKYVQFPDEVVVGALKGAGFSEGLSKAFVEMQQAFNARRVKTLAPRTPANTGATTLESFAEGWAKAYQGA